MEAHRLRRADVHPPAALLVPLHRAAAAPAHTQRGPLNVFHDADEVLVLLRVAAGAGVGEVERLPQLGAVDGRHHRTGGGGPAGRGAATGGAGAAGRSYRRPPAVVAGVEEGGRRGARGGRRWELRSGEGRRGGGAAGRPAAWRAGGEVSGGGGAEPSAGAGLQGFWADPGILGFGPLPKAQIQGPRQRCFYFFKKDSLPSASDVSTLLPGYRTYW